ncbi:AT-rich interactive domain-containing protein 1B-like isoform X3 [Leptonychotes weddellii]|uniref:AT-rich interactive domain-containing protein 1B-like isoform X3 n=1 Tax=Leptonychotes weddellii TaxID=9713 RepID=A0A7F8QF98_LEPWE|nr:AT-rich interactive domain-containing protein 1B-like isoform X3 [Leptonychotes weddellii]
MEAPGGAGGGEGAVGGAAEAGVGAGALIWVSPKSARAGGRGWGEGEKDLIHGRFNSFRHRRALGATVASGGPAGGGTWGRLTWAPACAGPASRGRSQRPVRPGAAPVTNEDDPPRGRLGSLQ